MVGQPPGKPMAVAAFLQRQHHAGNPLGHGGFEGGGV